MADDVSKTAPVAFSEVLDALDFASVGEGIDTQAYICVSTGRVHFMSDANDPEEDALPEGFEDSDDYLAVPTRRELNLGNRLVFSFAEEEMPEDYGLVRDMFRMKGAYGRWRAFLQGRRMLQRWYDFETKATEAALRAWCAENGVVLEDDQDPGLTG
jgi:hypothetical protein